MNKKDIRNFVWNTLGSMFMGFTSLFFMIIITRINGASDAGIFTYTFAFACTLYTIGAYANRTFQVTERELKISDSDYIYNRITTTALMFIIGILFCFITNQTKSNTIMIVLLVFYRGIEAIIDVFYGITQRNGDLYKVGISSFVRTIILVGLFLVINIMTKSMIASTIGICVTIIIALIADYMVAKKYFRWNKYNPKNNWYLLKKGFPVFLYSFFAIYVINSTKYAVNTYSSEEILAIFGIIIMPASFLSLVSTYIVMPFLNKISFYIGKKMFSELKTMMHKLMSGIVVIGIIAIGVCYIMGIPMLEFVYGIELSDQLINLIIILFGSIFYSLSIIISSIFIAMRKNNVMLVLLIITSIFAFSSCYPLTHYYGLRGASIAYLLMMIFEFLVHYIVILKQFNEGTTSIRLMGGLGNQMFEYAMLRARMMQTGRKGVIRLSGITNKTHNVYSLNHFNINKDIEIVKKDNAKTLISYLVYGFYCVTLVKSKIGFKVMQLVQPVMNTFGFICVPDGYIGVSNVETSNEGLVGYFQSPKYFKKYKNIIREELRVTDPIQKENKKVLKEIEKSNSVCVHIRRGDYVGTNHQVCDENYYLNAIKYMNKKVKDCKYFIFSDDIEWVKENISFSKKDDIKFIDWKNANYEELRLMYSCKHFIISNSSFSWWAQYLTYNDSRITIAPKKWFQNANQRTDISEDDWIKL